MNTDDLDRDAYSAWWEAEGRADLTVCPCGQPAEDWIVVGMRLPAGHGLCPRHRLDLSGGNRETMAQAIIAGQWFERDLDPWEARRAERVAEGKPPLDA
jgi:hypothetical protein